jgi:hypothetical protein
MTKLQASMKDASAKRWRETKLYYKCGSYFKGCGWCGETIEEGRRTFYLSGYNVFRAYDPKAMGWTWKCMDCNSTDSKCWDTEEGYGNEKVIIPRGLVFNPMFNKNPIGINRESTERARLKVGTVNKVKPVILEKERVPQVQKLSSREIEIMALEARVRELTAMLKK